MRIPMVAVAMVAAILGLGGGIAIGWVLGPYSTPESGPEIDRSAAEDPGEQSEAAAPTEGAADTQRPAGTGAAEDQIAALEDRIDEMQARIDEQARQLAAYVNDPLPAGEGALRRLPVFDDMVARAEEGLGRALTAEERERLRAEFERLLRIIDQMIEIGGLRRADLFVEDRQAEVRADEAIAAGNAMALLEAAQQDGLENPARLLEDNDAMNRLSRASEAGTRHSIDNMDGVERLGDGDTIYVPAGYHVLDRRFGYRNLPDNLTIVGSGRDVSAIEINRSTQFSYNEQLTVTFRDVTVRMNGTGLTDLRVGRAVYRFERARVVGFDYGAGGSNLLDVRSSTAVALVYATHSVFASGYDSGHGNLFDGNVYVRCTHCRFVGPELGTFGENAHYVDCTFVGAPEGETNPGSMFNELEREAERGEITLVRPIYERVLASDTDSHGRVRRSLSDINPEWPGRDD